MKLEKIAELYKECSSKITEKTQEIYQFILGVGSENADIMVISDVPTAEEDGEGEAFCGKTGLLLNRHLEKLGISRDLVYATHFVKYHPYKVNDRSGRITKRPARKDEIDWFLPYILEEITIMAPKIIITLGEMCFRALMEDQKLSLNKEHGRVHTKYIQNVNYKIFPVFHPATQKDEELIMTDADRELLYKLIHVVDEETRAGLKNEDVSLYNIAPKKSVMKPEKVVKTPESPKKNTKHKVLLIYGGDGYADDPTLIAIERISNVMIELNTGIHRLDLYKEDYNIQEVFEEMKYTQAVIIATTVEWLGIGAPLQRFLDLCWKFGNKEMFSSLYLFGVVISRQGNERDAYHHLIRSWELLGGLEGSSLLASIKKSIQLETNAGMLNTIDKKTEEFYRTITGGRVPLPTSIRENRVVIEVPKPMTMDSTDGMPFIQPKSEEERGMIPDYDMLVEKQQKDIEDISNLFKKKLVTKKIDGNLSELDQLKSRYKGMDDALKCKLSWQFNDQSAKNFLLDIKGKKIEAAFGESKEASILIQSDYKVFMKILEGKMTFQRAFMTGEIKAKGDFTILYKLDGLFDFS